MEMQPVMVGIAGGTGSGKTTVARRVLEAFGEDAMLLDMDSYYTDLSHLSLEERRRINFDHPDAFDTALFVSHLQALRRGHAVEKPVYSFKESVRLPETIAIVPSPVIIVEGILVLNEKAVREMFDARVFVEADDDIRFIRRLQRDLVERKRSIESVISQYLDTVRPMHLTFVEPSKRYADVIIPRGGKNEIAIQMVISDLRARVLGVHGV